MKEALKLALETLRNTQDYKQGRASVVEAVEDIEEALAQPTSGDYALGYTEGFNDACKPKPAQPAQEPVGVFCEDDDIGYVRLIPHQQMKLKAWDKLYTAPQQRPWVGLTDKEIREIHVASAGKDVGFATGLTEAKLKEKNQ